MMPYNPNGGAGEGDPGIGDQNKLSIEELDSKMIERANLGEFSNESSTKSIEE